MHAHAPSRPFRPNCSQSRPFRPNCLQQAFQKRLEVPATRSNCTLYASSSRYRELGLQYKPIRVASTFRVHTRA
eukprot:6282120-Heterocapsa_arctica.AAC.1